MILVDYDISTMNITIFGPFKLFLLARHLNNSDSCELNLIFSIKTRLKAKYCQFFGGLFHQTSTYVTMIFETSEKL